MVRTIILAGLLSACGPVPAGDAGAFDGGSDAGDSGVGADPDARVVPGDPPPWDPPFDIEPDVGWRDSTAPVCSPFAGAPNGGAVWADARGVFVLVGVLNNPFASDPPYPDGVSVHFNDGSGWELWHEVAAEPGSDGATQFQGVTGGPIFLWGGACPLVRIDGPGTATCAYDDEPVQHAAFASATAGLFALGIPTRVSAFDGATAAAPLVTLGPTEQVTGLWRDGASAIVVTTDAVRAGPIAGPLGPVAGVPEGPYLGVFAASTDDWWVGASEPPRLLHHDAGAWTEIEAPMSTPDAVRGLWADGGSVFFVSGRAFGTYSEANGVEIVAEIPLSYPATFTGIAGDAAAGEVYLSIVDTTYVEYACGPTMLVVYDGSTLRRF